MPLAGLINIRGGGSHGVAVEGVHLRVQLGHRVHHPSDEVQIALFGEVDFRVRAAVAGAGAGSRVRLGYPASRSEASKRKLSVHNTLKLKRTNPETPPY